MLTGRVLFSWIVILLAAVLIMAACGSSSGLQSLSITPATADAKSYPNGQVQFTAAGPYGGSTHSTSANVLWWSSPPWVFLPASIPTPTPGFLITTAGLASCISGGPSGTFTVWATAPVNQSINLSQMTRSTKQLTATAQITCP